MTKEFKQKAVELTYARGNTKEISEELGIDKELLYRWRKESKKYEGNSFPAHGTPKITDLEKEFSHLRKELRDVKMERTILKKAISIFSVSDEESTIS